MPTEEVARSILADYIYKPGAKFPLERLRRDEDESVSRKGLKRSVMLSSYNGDICTMVNIILLKPSKGATAVGRLYDFNLSNWLLGSHVNGMKRDAPP